MTKAFSIIFSLLLVHTAVAQKAVMPAPIPLGDDVAALKQKADAGNVTAQLTLAEKLIDARRPIDALTWYQRNAAKGNVEACFRLGELLLFGAVGMTEQQRVAPKPQDGLRWTYRAATNLHARACRNMSRSLQIGLGTGTNLVQAFAWMQLYAERDLITGRHELNNLALHMDTRDIQEGQKLVRKFKGRQWPGLPVLKAEVKPLPLKLDGMSSGGRTPLAVINGRSLAAGEGASIPSKEGPIEIKCLQIDESSVLILVAGETEPRSLQFESKLVVGGPR